MMGMACGLCQWRVVIVVVLMVCSSSSVEGAAPTARGVQGRPNIIYLMADDLNAEWKNDRHQVVQRFLSLMCVFYAYN